MAITEKPVDMHVHLVGNGLGGSGCWVRVKGWHRPLAEFMLRQIGLPLSLRDPGFDASYVERLLQQVRELSLGAIVLLAHDQVYESSGRVMNRGASRKQIPISFFYAPSGLAPQISLAKPAG